MTRRKQQFKNSADDQHPNSTLDRRVGHDFLLANPLRGALPSLPLKSSDQAADLSHPFEKLASLRLGQTTQLAVAYRACEGKDGRESHQPIGNALAVCHALVDEQEYLIEDRYHLAEDRRHAERSLRSRASEQTADQFEHVIRELCCLQ
jgi:hypothetical protein